MFKKEVIKYKIRSKRGMYERERKKKFDKLRNTNQYDNYLKQKITKPQIDEKEKVENKIEVKIEEKPMKPKIKNIVQEKNGVLSKIKNWFYERI